ncbi:periplasmic binding protein [Nannochloropsis oceanica]
MRRVAMGAMALASLSAYSTAARVEECLIPSTYSVSKDYFPAAAGATVDEARKFTIEYVQGYKVVTNLKGKRQYILYPCGAPEPDVAGLTTPEGFERRFLSVPAQKVVTAETVSYDFLNLLQNDQTEMGVTDRVIALSSYSSDACAQKALSCSSNVMAPGVSAASPGWGAKAEEFDAVMKEAGVYFDYSETYEGTATKDKTVIFSATSETSLLGRGEWIKFVGAFFNLDGVAEQKFEETKETYYKLSDAAKSENDARPKVSFLQVDTFGDKIVDYYGISVAGYKRSAVLDAGGWIANLEDFVGLPGVNFTTAMSTARWEVPKAAGPERDAAIKAFTEHLKDTDILIDERYSSTTLTRDEALAAYGLTSADVEFPFIKNGKFFRQDKTGSASGSAWFETGVSRPDVVLMDFIKVVHPTTSLVAKHDTVFLRDLFKGEEKKVITAEECTRGYPVCGLALTDKAAAICPSDSFKTCSNGSKVFLSTASGCTKYKSCPMKSLSEYTGLPTSSNIILGVFLSLAGLLLLACGFMWGKKRVAARAGSNGLSPNAASMH